MEVACFKYIRKKFQWELTRVVVIEKMVICKREMRGRWTGR